jgi:nucleotide-binding universal stress UspA family protein
MQVLAFVDLTNRKLNSNLGGSTLTLPDLVQGDEIRLGMRFSKQIEGTATEVLRNINSIRASIGFVDARPTAGTFQLYVDGDAAGSPLSFDATAAQVKSALEEVYSSTATVTFKDGSWLVDVADATEAQLTITGTSVSLEPTAHVRVRSFLVGSKTRHEIRLIRLPLASTSTFSNSIPAAPSITRVQAGGRNGTTIWNEIQALKITPEFRGVYQLRRGFKKSSELSIEDGAEEIQEAIQQLADEDGEFTVTNPNNNTAHITFGGESMEGKGHDLIEAVVFSAPPGDPTFVLNLNTAELADALRAVDNITTAVLEVEMTIEDENDPETLYTITPIRVPVRIIRELNWEGLETAANIDWLRPPHGRTYIPFTEDQIITGSQHYVAPIGDGTNTEYTLTHNLGTRDLHVTLRKNDGESAIVDRQFSVDGEDLYVSYAVTLDSEDDLTIKFKTPPTANQYVATITTAGPISAFQAHTHTIEQIEGLNLLLDDIGSRVETLETIVIAAGPGQNDQKGEGTKMQIEEIDITIPAGSSLPNGRLPLLGAVHDATVSPAEPPFAVETFTGQVKQLSTPWLIPSARNRKAWPVASNGYIASNGSVMYEVRKNGNSYFPVEYEHDIFLLWIAAEMLTAKRSLTLSVKPSLQLLGNTRAQYMLEVAFGTLQESQGSNYGPNLANLQWATPIISQRLILSSTIVEHSFGLSVSSDASSVLSATSTLYGRSQNATPPSNSAFAIRARLLNFDTEDREGTRGAISLKMEAAELEIA